MSKTKTKGNRLRRSRRRDYRRARLEEHVRAFVAETERGPDEERALLAALPHTGCDEGSLWVTSGVERAARVSGKTAPEVLALLERWQRYSYRTGRLPAEEVAFQVVGFELRRRAAGEEPRVVELPVTREGAAPSTSQIQGMIAQWEAFNYGAALTEAREPAKRTQGRLAALLMVALHLADTDGLPLRFGRLDPDAFACELEELPPAAGRTPRPPHYLTTLLGCASELYERLGEQGLLERKVAESIANKLGTLALGSRAA